MGKFSAFMQPLKSLPVGTHTFRYKLGRQFFVDMESSDVRDADLDVILTVKYDGDVYALDFAITGESLWCATVVSMRCSFPSTRTTSSP